jgi:ADP-dependent NAD(P)H-hydrate dehydratase / NAD(P)H-hydrate epimerase
MGALPDWCDPLPDADAMRAIDRWAIDQQGVPSIELMQRAGDGVARAVEELAADGPVTVLCGKGNNGGDGLVAARLLRETGRTVYVLLAGGTPAELQGDARANLLALPGEAPAQLAAEDPGQRERLRASTALVDALLGTGFAGEPRGAVAAAIAAIESAGVPVVSVDVPSGVDASTGAVAADAVHATITVTFHTAKPGLWIHPGKSHAGAARVIDIGIPRGAPTAATVGLIQGAVLAGLPRRGAASTKFTSGHLLVAGGSRGLTGAPLMAARAAQRAGAGYVGAYVPASQQPILAAAGTPELMTHALPEDDGACTPDAVAAVLDAATDRRSASGGALVLGPGLGRSPGAFVFARELAQRAALPLVIDADALNAHAGRLAELAERAHPTVLTPHAGELGRLLQCSSEEIARERLHHVRAAAALAQAVVVLKGDDTLIADPAGRVAVSPGDSPALATAGTGDVLSGVLGALLAQGLDAFTAAAAGVWLHLQAGRTAAWTLGGSAECVIASDVIAALPAARIAGVVTEADAWA